MSRPGPAPEEKRGRIKQQQRRSEIPRRRKEASFVKRKGTAQASKGPDQRQHQKTLLLGKRKGTRYIPIATKVGGSDRPKNAAPIL